jgi:hypothetical protein
MVFTLLHNHALGFSSREVMRVLKHESGFGKKEVVEGCYSFSRSILIAKAYDRAARRQIFDPPKLSSVVPVGITCFLRMCVLHIRSCEVVELISYHPAASLR